MSPLAPTHKSAVPAKTLVVKAVVTVVPNCVQVIPSFDKKNFTSFPTAPLSTSRVARIHLTAPSVTPVATVEILLIVPALVPVDDQTNSRAPVVKTLSA